MATTIRHERQNIMSDWQGIKKLLRKKGFELIQIGRNHFSKPEIVIYKIVALRDRMLTFHTPKLNFFQTFEFFTM